MKTIDIARRAARGLRNAKARTILTSLAIAVGAFTITISLAAGEGARQYADKLIGSNVNPRALFIVKDKSIFEGGGRQAGLQVYDPDVGTTSAGLTLKQMTQVDIDKLKARDDLENVTPTYAPSVRYMTFGDDTKKFSGELSAYDPTILSEAAYGTLPSLGDDITDQQAVVPEAFATTLVDQGAIKAPEDLIGMTVTMTAVSAKSTATTEEIAAAYATGGAAAVEALSTPETKEFVFTVSAITKKSATALAGTSAIQISGNEARAISEFTTEGTEAYQKYLGATALVVEGNDPAEVKEELLKDDFYAQTAEDLQGVVFAVVNTLQGIVLGFGIVALIASVFGIINTQYISVLERTREIGLMKALGMRGRAVSRLFQFEAAWIGFLGGIIGTVIAVCVGLAINPWLTEVLGIGEGNYILIFQPIPIAIMIVVLMVIAMLAGWFPARKAAKLDPIEALRTE
ncbi:MAG: FtsX-like permease family protein [Patescibacteria group bacterium]